MINIAFGKRIFLIITGVAVFSAVIVALPSVINYREGFKSFAINQVRADARLVSAMSGPAVVFDASDLAIELLKLLAESESFVAAVIYVPNTLGEGHLVFASYGEQASAFSLPDELPREQEIDTLLLGSNLRVFSNIYENGNKVGLLQVVADLSQVEANIKQTVMFITIAFFVSILFALYLARFFRKILLSPIKSLNETAQEIAQTKDYSRRAVKIYDDELGELTQSFNNMLSVIQRIDIDRNAKEDEILKLNESLEKRVTVRTMELEQNMQVLRKTVDDLRRTQQKLAEQEKMAALGGLVSGVAHEINTPIGVAITASSHLTQTVNDLTKQFTQGTLTKAEFSEAIHEMTETNVMVLKNLERAAALVKSFKMVAVDQANEDVRTFNVKEYIETVLISLGPKLKRTSHKVIVDAPDSITVTSSPGALSQIITNLVINSLVHGFEDIKKGTIKIVVTQQEDKVHIDYYDDGRGVDPSIKKRIFDPFVTTARHKGGSGLGTHIMYNLVHQVLGGTLSLEDDVEKGVHFAISFPENIAKNMVQPQQVGAS